MVLNHILVCKHDPMGDRTAQDTVISITSDIPASINTIEVAGPFYQRQADTIVDALVATLPQGTLDRLVATLLTHKAKAMFLKTPL